MTAAAGLVDAVVESGSEEISRVGPLADGLTRPAAGIHPPVGSPPLAGDHHERSVDARATDAHARPQARGGLRARPK